MLKRESTLIVSLNLSVGMELYFRSVYEWLSKKTTVYAALADSVQNEEIYKTEKGFYWFSTGGSKTNFVFSSFNPLVHIKFLRLLSITKPTSIFFISSHPLNIFLVPITRFLFRKKVFVHIHDPLPHSGYNFIWKFFILFTNYCQSFCANHIIVFSHALKLTIEEKYRLPSSKISVIKHGACRQEINQPSVKGLRRQYISMLGIMREYKGIDIFLNAILLAKPEWDNFKRKSIKFLIKGEGDIDLYFHLIDQIDKDLLVINNVRISNEEFDETLQKSLVLVLPYKDATQTGNIPLAYYNSCPVIISNVGGLPELVVQGQTGVILKENSPQELLKEIMCFIYNESLGEKYQNAAFDYYLEHLKWSTISHNLFDTLSLNN